MSRTVYSYKHHKVERDYRRYGWRRIDTYIVRNKGTIYKKAKKRRCRCDWCMPDYIPKRQQGKASDRRRMQNTIEEQLQ